MVKENLVLLKDPKFSFYRYLDEKLSAAQPMAQSTTEVVVVGVTSLNQDQSQSPAKSPLSTPKFVNSEDNTQTKTNYNTEPSIGTILINFTNKLNNRYVITSTKKEQNLFTSSF